MAKSLRTKVRNARAQYEAAFKARWNAEYNYDRAKSSVIFEINLNNSCGFFVEKDPRRYPEVIEAFNALARAHVREHSKSNKFHRLFNKK
jgi:hypothetical protein